MPVKVTELLPAGAKCQSCGRPEAKFKIGSSIDVEGTDAMEDSMTFDICGHCVLELYETARILLDRQTYDRRRAQVESVKRISQMEFALQGKSDEDDRRREVSDRPRHRVRVLSRSEREEGKRQRRVPVLR